jgi:hypothetical protein
MPSSSSAILALRSVPLRRMPMLGRSPKPSSCRTYTPGTSRSTLWTSSSSKRSSCFESTTCADPGGSASTTVTVSSIGSSGGAA